MTISQNCNILVIREQWMVPPSSYFTDSYWFIFHFLHQERERWISSTTTQPPGTDNYQLFFVMKRESELDSFKWLSPQALVLYLCWFTRCWQSFWFLITFITFIKVKVFRTLASFNSKSFRKWFLLIIPFFVRNFQRSHIQKSFCGWIGLQICITYLFHLQYGIKTVN